jgi:DinB superfamily
MARVRYAAEEAEKFVGILEETPKRIAASTAGMTKAQLRTAPGPRAWSAVEILAHLRACDDLWTFSLYAMLAEPRQRPALPRLDERRWARARGYARLEFGPSLKAFTLARAELLGTLRGLPEEAWSLTADIGGRNHSVFSQVRRLALHEVEHRGQFEALIAQD